MCTRTSFSATIRVHRYQMSLTATAGTREPHPGNMYPQITGEGCSKSQFVTDNMSLTIVMGVPAQSFVLYAKARVGMYVNFMSWLTSFAHRHSDCICKSQFPSACRFTQRPSTCLYLRYVSRTRQNKTNSALDAIVFLTRAETTSLQLLRQK
jgi:hypothetical protein